MQMFGRESTKEMGIFFTIGTLASVCFLHLILQLHRRLHPAPQHDVCLSPARYQGTQRAIPPLISIMGLTHRKQVASSARVSDIGIKIVR